MGGADCFLEMAGVLLFFLSYLVGLEGRESRGDPLIDLLL